jgi:hypothetical protein
MLKYNLKNILEKNLDFHLVSKYSMMVNNFESNTLTNKFNNLIYDTDTAIIRYIINEKLKFDTYF